MRCALCSVTVHSNQINSPLEATEYFFQALRHSWIPRCNLVRPGSPRLQDVLRPGEGQVHAGGVVRCVPPSLGWVQELGGDWHFE